jgi:hypothetical protein
MRYLYYTFLLFSAAVSGQIKVVLKDSITNKPIPYLGIWSLDNDYVISSNKKGKIEIDKKFSNDTFYCFTTEYKNKSFKVDANTKEIFLSKAIKENRVCNKENERLVYTNESIKDTPKKIFSSSSSTSLTAYLIACHECNEETFLSKILLNELNHLDTRVFYKIRFFENENNQPGKEIGNQNITVYVPGTKKVNGLVSLVHKRMENIDLLPYGLKVNKNGFFVAIEYIDVSRNRLTLDSTRVTLSPSFFLTDAYTLKYRFTKGVWEKVINNETTPFMKIYVVQ